MTRDHKVNKFITSIVVQTEPIRKNVAAAAARPPHRERERECVQRGEAVCRAYIVLQVQTAITPLKPQKHHCTNLRHSNPITQNNMQPSNLKASFHQFCCIAL